ncbi:hypothetical protein [Streptomyces sp. 7N604]|uniref:hypothetical protein n=1 Tax=Streptomyces sp. 7N604 TaxID=3457415 RepID=UPI003FD0386C
MSLTTSGKPPGPVRFYLLCDHRDCEVRAVFDMVISDPGPSIDEDLIGHLLHSASTAAPHIEELGWTFIQGDGYWCPTCSTPPSKRRRGGGRAKSS